MFTKKFTPFSPTGAQDTENSHDAFAAPAAAPVWAQPEENTFIPQNYHAASVTNTRRNVLNSDVEVEGILKFDDDLLIDGHVNGKIFSEAVLTIGQNAIIQAEIKSKSVIIEGKVTGNVMAQSTVELRSTAELIGDIQAEKFAVEAGAVYIGKATVGAPSVDINIAKASAKNTLAPADDNELFADAVASQQSSDGIL